MAKKPVQREIYYYKDKPYRLVEETFKKTGDVWTEVVIYKRVSQSGNLPHLWVRDRAEFYEKFKTKTQLLNEPK